MSMIKSTITNAADITILKLSDNTYKTGGGPVGIGACVVESPKGPVGRAVFATDDTWQALFGKPYHPREGAKAEGLRHLADAAKDCQGVQVVRVVAEDAAVPSISFMDDGTTLAGTHAFDTVVSVDSGVLMTVFPKDGDPSTRRKLSITSADDRAQRVTLEVLETDNSGDDLVVERLTFGFDPDDVDDMGVTAYIEAVFENQSTYLDVAVNRDATVTSFAAFAAAEPVKFEGGTNGGTPTTQDYIKAWSTFRDMRIDLNFMFAAGSYDPEVIGNMVEIADGRHVQFYFDAPPSLRNDGAIKWLNDAGLVSRQGYCYHGAYSFTDPYYGGRAVWGYSGAAAASRARSNAIFAGNVPGIHYSIAGEKRGTVNRRGAKPLFGSDPINKDAFYKARINPILANETGAGVIIGDDMAIHFKENYSRFGWVNSITNFIVHRFLQAASAAKFEPDGLTREILTDLTVEIMEELVTAGALVKPRNPEVDGDSPFVVTVKQLEIDLWQVTWEICPVGAARRIAGQPKLIK
ncbi:hypothetical protein ACT3R7_12075 [Halomonas sp. AOP43-A1-21]